MKEPLKAIPRSRFLLAMSVNILTASGAAAGILALERAFAADFKMMFAWLALAFAIDGIDGTLARRFRVREAAPFIDGDVLDCVVDYLTYVVVPLTAIWKAQLMEPVLGIAAIAFLAGASSLYFADTRMKTADQWFRGFPALWNIVAIYLFTFPMPGWAVFAVLAVLCVAMFVPAVFVHPMRVKHMRAVTLGVVAIWFAAAALLVWNEFAGPLYAKIVLAGCALYVVALPAWRNSIWAAGRKKSP